MRGMLLLAVLMGLCGGVARAQSGAELFVATNLGSNGLSCASCHPAGKGLEEIAAYDDRQLREMINFCIRDALQGTLLPDDAPQLQRLLEHLRSLNAQP